MFVFLAAGGARYNEGIFWKGGRPAIEQAMYGYARVSTREQNEARQLDALTAAGIARRDIYLDKQSGKDFDRPQYQRLLQRLRPASGKRRRLVHPGQDMIHQTLHRHRHIRILR